MSNLSYALVTPSYWRDLDRCALLVETVNRHVDATIPHYLVIARRDVHLFKPMLGGRTQLIVVEDIIPRWLFRAPGLKRFWLSLRTLPVRNWILQQLVKLSIPGVVNEDVLLYADSDMFFIEPFDPRAFERGGKVPLFMETGQRGLIDNNDAWHAVAARLLGVRPENSYDTNYVNQLVWWRRATALDALRRIEEVTRRDWAHALATQKGFSEYTLYGFYVDYVLGAENAGHWHDGVGRTLNYWQPSPLDRDGLLAFKASRQHHQHSVMVSSKSNTEVGAIRDVFFCDGAPAQAAQAGERLKAAG